MGDAVGDGDSSAAFFFAAFFGEAAGEASVEAVFLVVVFLLVVAGWVVAVVEVVAASSFFAHEPRNAAIVSAVIKAKRDVFIMVVKLDEGRACRVACVRARSKIVLFPS